MNINKFFKVLYLVITCALSTSDVFGMSETKQSALSSTYSTFAQSELEQDIKALPDNTRLDFVMGIIMKEYKVHGFMVSNWTRYLTPDQVQKVVKKLKTKAQEFIGDTLVDEKALKELPENFFKILVRNIYYERHGKKIDHVQMFGIFYKFGKSNTVTWTSMPLTSLTPYTDFLGVWNTIIPITHLSLKNTKIIKIEGLDSLLHLRSIDLSENQKLARQDNFEATIQHFKDRGTLVDI